MGCEAFLWCKIFWPARMEESIVPPGNHPSHTMTCLWRINNCHLKAITQAVLFLSVASSSLNNNLPHTRIEHHFGFADSTHKRIEKGTEGLLSVKVVVRRLTSRKTIREALSATDQIRSPTGASRFVVEGDSGWNGYPVCQQYLYR